MYLLDSVDHVCVVRPLTPQNWPDMGKVLGGNGDGGCWCMWWRLDDAAFEEGRGAVNKQAMKALVDADRTPGVIAYLDGQPAGWCAIGPRSEYPRLTDSGLLVGGEDEPIWSLVCYYVNPRFRGRGLMAQLTRGAVGLARTKGARIIEAYPVEIPAGVAAPGAYTGIASVLRNAGFTDFVKRGSRPVLRCFVQ